MSALKPVQGLQLEIFSSCEEQTRYHLDAELIYVLEGALRIHQGEHLVSLPREGMTIINPNVAYRAEQEGDVLFLRLSIPTQIVEDLTQNTRPFFWCDSTRAENQRYLFWASPVFGPGACIIWETETSPASWSGTFCKTTLWKS